MNPVNEFIQSYGSDVLQIAIAWIVSIVIFAALIIYISKHPQKRNMPVKLTFCIMFLGGMALYCTCHYMEVMQVPGGKPPASYLKWVNDKSGYASLFRIPYVIVRSVADAGMMFWGRINSDVFFNLDISEKPLAVFIFWLIHLIAFYTAAAALLIRFGNELLKWIRITTSGISEINLIFGINADSIMFGRNAASVKGSMLVCTDSIIREDYESSIRAMGGLTFTDKDALTASPAFLKKIRMKPGKMKLKLYALSEEYDRNLQYARMMSGSLKTLGISPEQTKLVLLGTDEWKGMFFQSGESHYGYGSVMSFDEAEMTARLLMHEYPLCDAINFDENGRALDDTDVLIVGFGRLGHEVLREVIANGQFEGSKFHATVYDPNYEHRTGFLRSQYPGMFVNYNIDFEPQNGRGSKIFKFLQDNASKLKYIVVCLDDRDLARDIAVHMADRLQALGYSLNVYTCDSKSVRCYSQYAQECKTHWLYDSELLYSAELDQYAMELNHRYTGGKDKYEDWKNCDYFGRMSSRASVDYLIPLTRRIKNMMNTEELTHEQRENLARCEHLRWCAFHYTFGFDVMDKEEFAQRVKDYQNEIRAHGKSSIKITKDTKALKHVCLVDWDELDEISRIENSITHGNRNYKDSDRKNVDMVMELMQS